VVVSHFQISAKTQTIAIIGDPIKHSLTPRIQNTALRAIDADLLNVAFRVSPDDLKSAILGARSLGILGLMVTIPHKEAVLELCDELNESATLLGAANLLHFRPDGKIVGHSSDGWGAVKSLEENGVSLAGKNVTILGGGGSARSLALTLTQENVASIRLVNRTISRAQVIADEIEKLGVKVEVFSTDALSEALAEADLLINTTSVGMTPNIDETPLDKSFLRPELAVFDIVYNPLETRLLREAREVGAKAIDGLGMLIYTNVYAAKVCAGLDISVPIMRDEAMRAFAERDK
jgi:shikimate dehydrogenase